ncbi:hypothetical protein FACS1894207_3190 [Bacteroidia bacterium]|nr:hypothetical protein FACS1894207_3190 [Bacteroidia bacterium]
MNEQQILIKKPFNEQYTLLIETDSMLINASLKSKTQARYDFSVINIEKDIIECRLMQLDLFVVESNNDLVKEIAQVTAAFNRMFNELHLKLNEKGEILEILNIDLILSKWKQTKTEMQKIARANDDIKQLIIINDNLLAQPEKIKIAIKANEFLQVFFGKIFGVNISSKVNEMGTNLLNTTNLAWSFLITDIYEQQNLNRIKIISEAEPQYSLNSKFYHNAYQQFAEHIDLSKLSVKLEQHSEYLIDKDTNRVIQAQINKIEEVHPNKLYMKLCYTLMCDEMYVKSLKNNIVIG